MEDCIVRGVFFHVIFGYFSTYVRNGVGLEFHF